VKEQEMTSKERFLIALNVKKPDRVPLFDFLDSQNLWEHLIGRRPSAYDGEGAVECTFKLGYDAVWVPFGGYSGYIEGDISIDEWGTTWKDTGYSWPGTSPIDYPIKTRGDFRKMKIPDPTIDDRLDDIKAALKRTQKKIAVVGGILGPFSMVYYLMGLETLGLTLYDDPDLIRDLHKVVNEFLIEAAKRVIEAGVDAVCVADDIAYHSGPFLSPSDFRKYSLPYIAELIQEIRKRGVPVIFHSDGNLNLILDDLVDTGINALNPIEKNANMDLKEIKEKYGRKICLIGGVDNQVLSGSTPEDVEREVRKDLDIAAPGGGYIPSSDSGDLLDVMPLENIWAMIDLVKKYYYSDVSRPNNVAGEHHYQ